MNQLEKTILGSAIRAQNLYKKISGGWWLSHGPEYFITSTLATDIFRLGGYSVFMEASPRKILNEITQEQRNADNIRFDLAIWEKSTNKIRAIIEIKMARDINVLIKDKIKITDYKRINNFVKNGYILFYTELKTIDKLKSRLSDWPDKLNCTLVGHKVDEKGDGTWKWAIALLKVR